MNVVLIILGLAVCSYETPVHTFIGAGLIIWGILRAIFKKKPTPPPHTRRSSTDSEGYTGRTAGEQYHGVRDRDGNFIHESDLRETIDGDFITPDGDVVSKDSDGEYRSYY